MRRAGVRKGAVRESQGVGVGVVEASGEEGVRVGVVRMVGVVGAESRRDRGGGGVIVSICGQ